MFHQFPFLPYFIPSHHMFRSTDLPRRCAALSLSRLAVVRELAVPSFLSLLIIHIPHHHGSLPHRIKS